MDLIPEQLHIMDSLKLQLGVSSIVSGNGSDQAIPGITHRASNKEL